MSEETDNQRPLETNAMPWNAHGVHAGDSRAGTMARVGAARRDSSVAT